MLSPPQPLLVLAAFLLFCLTTARLAVILPSARRTPKPRPRGSPTHLLIVLGSGGHTAEMLAMLHGLDTRSYRHRTYVVSEGDPISAIKARSFERELCRSGEEGNAVGHGNSAENSLFETGYGSYSLVTIPRARKVHQSLLTAPFSCLRTLFAALHLLLHGAAPLPLPISPVPDLILTNGPATSVLVIFASIILRFFDFRSMGHARTRIIYAESFARIKTLSLSAKVVAWAVDRLLVQWEQLHGQAWGRAEYTGLLIMDGLKKTRTSANS